MKCFAWMHNKIRDQSGLCACSINGDPNDGVHGLFWPVVLLVAVASSLFQIGSMCDSLVMLFVLILLPETWSRTIYQRHLLWRLKGGSCYMIWWAIADMLHAEFSSAAKGTPHGVGCGGRLGGIKKSSRMVKISDDECGQVADWVFWWCLYTCWRWYLCQEVWLPMSL